MPLESGQMLSHYRLAEKIGEGGMGVVWKADDTRLERQVAIKLLPEQLTSDPERLARFEREAKVLASLNHPNIAAIYGLDQDAGNHFLVLELVQGEDLAAVMSRGVIPVEEAVRLAAQIAEALEAAHENQVVHRDLKPANVKLTPDGRVKVLDFGLAKVWAPEGSDTSLSFSPTITAYMTQAGVILGTAAYMSPEQARGQAVDKRSDIWAFGVLLYEMLVGTQLFAGDTATDILGAIVHRKPDWDRLPETTPPGLVRLLKRCLTQELPDRLRDIGEARYALNHLDDEQARPAGAQDVAAPAAGTGPWKILAGLLLLASVALVLALVMSPRPQPTVLRATIDPPPGQRLLSTAEVGGQVRVSPDGRALAYVAQDDKGVPRVWVRTLDAADSRPVPGTEDGRRPFWSPDSRSLAFFSGGKLRRVSLEGGGALAVANAPDGRGGSWSPDGMIVFAPGPGATLLRVPAGGGDAVEITDFLQGEGPESSHREPRFLPDGKHFLFLAQSSQSPDWRVYVGHVDGGKGHYVTNTSGGAAYAEGYLLTLRGTTLVAQSFDPGDFALSGDPMPVAEDVTLDSNYGIGVFSVGPGGVLAYQSGSRVTKQLTWMSADGTRLEGIGPADNYDQFDLSEDGSRAVVSLQESDGIRDLWIIDMTLGTRTRFTFSSSESPATHSDPIWSPDGREIAYASNRSGTMDLFRKPADGVGKEREIVRAESDLWSYDWSPDGNYIVYGHEQPQYNSAEDLIALPVSGEGEPIRVMDTPFNEWPASFSPDGRWLAYDSPESGRREIYVVPFPGLDGRWQVSVDGGRYPRWSPDGRRLYFWNAGKLMAVPVQASGNTLQAGVVQNVLDVSWGDNLSWYAMSPQEDRFLLLAPDSSLGPTSISLFLNWQQELARR